ncbi:hypothetical protein V1264_022690 [Littorina saxatilis]|uniref:Uncharacterized protein n=2 Tax=Littorina saxatilis TaxID=31220 RepID=A0AAN9AKY3_9CAEN
MLRRWVRQVLCWRGSRLLRQRLFLAGLFLFTLLVIVARLEAEADLWALESNTLVLQAGFPAVAVNSSLSAKHLGLRLTPPRDVITTPLIQPRPKMAAYVAAQKQKWLKTYYAPALRQGERTPSCQKLILGEEEEQQRGLAFIETHERLEKPPSAYIEDTRNCSRFIRDRGYVMTATAEEREFPIAYSIMMYTGVEQTERMLRAIYRPHNYHCIHVDRKSPEEIMAAMRTIAGCLPNVFVASKLNAVYWATWSSLEALIFCMQDLMAVSGAWKYYINLTGQEFPLKTNLQLVRILKALNGSNIVDASTDP